MGSARLPQRGTRAHLRTARTMTCNPRTQHLLVACALCLSAPVATAGDWSSAINLERLRVTVSGATTVGSLEGRPSGAKRNFTERSFDFAAAPAQPKKWMLDFAFKSGDTAEPIRSGTNARIGEPVGFVASSPPVGEPRGNELVVRARYDF